MSCLLQTGNGDIDLSSHTAVVVQDEDTSIAQEVTNRFRLFLGEWFLDNRIGIPYFQRVFVKNPDLVVVSQLFRRVIVQTPGIKKVTSAALDFNNSTRALTAQFTAQTDSGAVIAGGPGSPFIVTDNGKGK